MWCATIQSMNKNTAVVSLLGVSLLTMLLVAAPAEASHSWGGYHWARTANPLVLKFGDNVSPAWDAYLTGTSADWSLSSVLDTVVAVGGTNATKGRNTPKNCLPTNGKVEVCNALYGSTGWLGIASVWTNGGHITQGTVKLNDTYFRTAQYNTPALKRLVTCQEIGHTFGLDHQDEIFDNANLGTCMDYTNDPSGSLYGQISNEHPNMHDYEELELIYAHLDSFTSSASAIGAAAAARAGDIDTSNPSEWGKAIRRSVDGRTSLHERDLGNGQKIFTFVTWAI